MNTPARVTGTKILRQNSGERNYLSYSRDYLKSFQCDLDSLPGPGGRRFPPPTKTNTSKFWFDLTYVHFLTSSELFRYKWVTNWIYILLFTWSVIMENKTTLSNLVFRFFSAVPGCSGVFWGCSSVPDFGTCRFRQKDAWLGEGLWARKPSRWLTFLFLLSLSFLF